MVSASRPRTTCLFTLAWLVAAGISAFVAPPDDAVLDDFDVRALETPPAELLRPDHAALVTERLGVPVQLSIEPIRGVPASLRAAWVFRRDSASSATASATCCLAFFQRLPPS